MRVLAFTYNYPPYRHIGSELTTADYLEHLAAIGHEVHVFSEWVQYDYARNGVRVHQWEWTREFDAKDYDVFITHPELRYKMWPIVQGLPYIALVHNAREETLRSLQRAEPDLTIANSHETARLLPPMRTGRINVLHPPLLANPKPKDYMHLPSTRLAYTAIGLSQDKGGDTFRYIAEQNPGLAFRGVKGGYGWQMGRELMTDNVELVEHTYPEHMDHIYSTARAVLVPSRSESYCKVVAEAMFNGVPVIASDLPAIREVGGDHITYVDPEDKDAWCDQVREMENPRRHTMMADLAYRRGKELARETIDTLDTWAELVTWRVQELRG